MKSYPRAILLWLDPLTAFHYEGSDFAVYSTSRMHSSYDIYKSACHCLCAVCELKSLGERFFIDGRIS